MSEREIVIAIEGHDSGDGRIIVPGALKFPDGPIPVIERLGREDYDGTVVGYATGFRRNGDEIIATLSVDLPVGKWPCIETQGIVTQISESGDQMTILEANLRGIFLAENPSWDNLLKDPPTLAQREAEHRERVMDEWLP